MRDQGIAGGARSSVSGLGVCDVWRLELSAVQWPWLLDELEEVRGPLEEALQRARAQEAVDTGESVADEVAALEHELRSVRTMRAQLPAAGHSEGIVFVGPVELVRDLVRGALRNVVDALSDIVSAQRRDTSRRLVETANAASDWARTVADCHELEYFCFATRADATLRHSADH